MKSSDWEKRKDSWTLMFIKKKSNIISIGKNNSTFISRKFSKWKKQQKFFFQISILSLGAQKSHHSIHSTEKRFKFRHVFTYFYRRAIELNNHTKLFAKAFSSKKISLWWGQKSFPKHLFRHNKDKMEAQSDIVNVVWLFPTYFCNYATDWR